MLVEFPFLLAAAAAYEVLPNACALPEGATLAGVVAFVAVAGLLRGAAGVVPVVVLACRGGSAAIAETGCL